ncbi:MAG: hypothetical protein ACI9J3_003882 [Parvicellaceae bacterium]|jgi:hypothetical protein
MKIAAHVAPQMELAIALVTVIVIVTQMEIAIIAVKN